MFKSCKCYREANLVKILPDSKSVSNYLDKDTLRVANIVSSKEYDEYVVLHSSMYEAIFGEKKAKAKRSKKLLSVVRICYEGKSIHRVYRSLPAKDFGKDFAALTPNSIYELCQDSSEAPKKVSVSKGCWWMYYWYNPVAAVRMSFRVGVVGILFTIIMSILPMILTQCINCH